MPIGDPTFLRKDQPGQVRLPKDMSKPDDKSVAELILNAPVDQKRVRTLEQKPARSWPKKSLIKGRKNALATVGLDLTDGDPDYVKVLKLSDNYRKHRARELVVVHGFVSAGVSSLLASGALALAASRYLYERAAKDGDVSLLMQASKLADSARQNELAAWELCKRESVDRKRAAAQQQGVPWLVSQSEKTGPGRPRKVDKIDAVVGYPSESSSTPRQSSPSTGSDAYSGSGEPSGSPEPYAAPDSERP